MSGRVPSARNLLSPRALEAFRVLSEELAAHDLLQFLALYDPASDGTVQLHSFEDTGLLASVLARCLDRVRSGEHARTRLTTEAGEVPSEAELDAAIRRALRRTPRVEDA